MMQPQVKTAPPTLPPPLAWTQENATKWTAIAPEGETWLIRRNASKGLYRLLRGGREVVNKPKLKEVQAEAERLRASQPVLVDLLPPPPDLPAPVPAITALTAKPGTNVRRNDPATSQKAADNPTYVPRRKALARRLGDQFREAWPNGLTPREVAEKIGVGAESGYWKRVSDLKNAGVLEATGQERDGQEVLLMTPTAYSAWTQAAREEAAQ